MRMSYSKNRSLILIAFVLVLTVFFLSTTSWFTSYKGRTQAYIVDDYMCYGTRGRGYYQCVIYAYVVDGKLYKAVEKVVGGLQIGSTFTIEYSSDNPNSNEVISYNNEFVNSKEEAFLHLKEEGYLQITLINGLYFFKEYGKEGILTSEEMGTYQERSDTLHLKTFTENHSRIFARINDDELVDVNTSQQYK